MFIACGWLYSNIRHNPVFINKRTGKQNRDIHTGQIFCSKKKAAYTHNNVNEFHRYFAKWKKLYTKLIYVIKFLLSN